VFIVQVFYQRCSSHPIVRYPKSFRGVFSAWDVTSFGDPSTEEDEGPGKAWGVQVVKCAPGFYNLIYTDLIWMQLFSLAHTCFLLFRLHLNAIMNFCCGVWWGRAWWMQTSPTWRDGFLHCRNACKSQSSMVICFQYLSYSTHIIISITKWSLQNRVAVCNKN